MWRQCAVVTPDNPLLRHLRIVVGCNNGAASNNVIQKFGLRPVTIIALNLVDVAIVDVANTIDVVVAVIHAAVDLGVVILANVF